MAGSENRENSKKNETERGNNGESGKWDGEKRMCGFREEMRDEEGNNAMLEAGSKEMFVFCSFCSKPGALPSPSLTSRNGPPFPPLRYPNNIGAARSKPKKRTATYHCKYSLLQSNRYV